MKILADRPATSWQYPAPDLGIANITALAYLAACLRIVKPRRILELGAGIGTMTTLMLEHPSDVEQIITTEDNDFCLNALEENLPEKERHRLKIVTSLDELTALDGTFDLAICDGGFDREEQFRGIGPGCMSMFEGGRAAHRRLFGRFLARFGWRYQPENHSSPGLTIKLLPMRWKLFGVPMPLIKIRRRKGCWLGWVEDRSEA
jgi:hypothetical protein